MKEKYRSLPIFFLVFIAFLPFRLYNFIRPLIDITNFRQAQTATITLNFFKNGINLFQTELDIFGIGRERFLTLEFPLYEAIVSVFYKIFFVSDMWGKTMSIMAGFIGAWFLYRLVILVFRNKKWALLSSFFFLSAPLNMYHQRDFLIETTVIAFLLGGFYYACHWIKKGNASSYFLAILFLALGFVQKFMYGPFLLLPLGWYFFKNWGKKAFFNAKFIILVLLSLLTLFLWQQRVNYTNNLNGHSYFTTTNKAQLLWNIGTVADRFSFPMWGFRIKQILNGIFLKPGLVIFLTGVLVLRKKKNSTFLYVWLFSQVIYFLTFFRIQSHGYYQMIVIPITSVFMSAGLLFIATKSRNQFLTSAFLAIFFAFFSYKSFLNSRWDSYNDWKWYDRLKLVSTYVPKNSYGIFVNPGYDWNSVYTYYPRLKLLLVSVEDFTPEAVEKLSQSGYTYIILHEFDKYSEYLEDVRSKNTTDFVKKYQEVLRLEDFIIYLIR